MIVLIDKLAGEVLVDGVARTVDLSALDQDIATVRYDTIKGVGLISYVGEKPNSSFGARVYPIYQQYHQAWKVAGAGLSKTLEDAKRDKREQINSKRDALEKSGFPYLGKLIDSDPISVARITSVVQVAQTAMATNQPFNIDWTTQDNSTLSLDAEGVIGMPVALVMFANDLHQHGRSKKAQIDAATTVAEVDAVDWDGE